ncbi:MAG TPA: cytochrome P450, partial [Pseudonocardiaceae bacterium]|nr:cytochrome P450 [Pseudonocardiaceae bacterium]
VTTSHGNDLAWFDILDPAFRVDSAEVRAAADAGWWARTPMGIAVLRYQECLALLRDGRLRHGSLDGLAAQGVTTGLFADWLRTMLLNLEGCPHQRQRRLVSKAFTQRGVEVLRPFMRATAHELIDGVAGNGRCEFMTVFADPYPAWVIAELLGIPTERFDAFLGWATDIGLGFSPAAAAEQDRIDAAVAGLYACCDELIAQRRDNPGDDLISTLIAAQTDGESLSTDELRILVNTLVFAGQDTTRNQLGLAITTLAQHPEQWRLLAQRPELASTAVEELMRVNPATPMITRVATEDFTFQDVAIATGTHVALFVGAANTEPGTFGDAPFDITAQRATQLTFGGGIHYCLGAWLARIEMREALPILASRLGDIALDGPVVSRPHVGITGPVTLPLRFAARAR